MKQITNHLVVCCVLLLKAKEKAQFWAFSHFFVLSEEIP
jgi:hypothetical protein